MSTTNRTMAGVWRQITAGQVRNTTPDFYVIADFAESDASIRTDLNGANPRKKFLTSELANILEAGTTNTGGGGTSSLAEGYIGGTLTTVPTGVDMNGRPFVTSVAPIQI